MIRALIAALLIASPAAAQQCAPRDMVVMQLATRHGEFRQSRGLNQGNKVVEIFVAKSGSWTIVISEPDGTSCLADAGTHFETAKIKKSKVGVKA